MTTDPRIEPMAIAICASRHRNHNAKVDYWAISGEYARSQYMDDATAAVAAIDKAAIITTVEELDALPVGSVVLSDEYRYSLTYPNYTVSFQKLYDDSWHRGGRASDTHLSMIVPAQLIHQGNE